LFTRYFFNLLVNLTNRPTPEIFKQVVLAFEKPARWFFVALGLILAIRYSPFLDEQMPVNSKIYRSLIVALFCWGLCNLTA
ncbi:mechanosensitive ion channel family protein, partial [Bacillus spizizenii]|nr:mechanosensitive ion channel family protein [Bacillus spizizenii]